MSKSQRSERKARILEGATWLVIVAASLVLLWLGVYRVLDPTGSESTTCVGVDMPWTVVGIILNLLVAGFALAGMRASAWAVGVALPGLGILGLLGIFPCSFLPQFGLPFLAALGIGFSLTVVVLWVLNPPAFDPDGSSD